MSVGVLSHLMKEYAMAKLHILDDDEFDRIAAILADRAIILMPRSLADAIKQDTHTLAQRAADYDFGGGDPDVYAEVVNGLDHFFLSIDNDPTQEN